VGNSVIFPPNKALNLEVANAIAGHFIKNYNKVEIIIHDTIVFKTLENQHPIISTTGLV